MFKPRPKAAPKPDPAELFPGDLRRPAISPALAADVNREVAVLSTIMQNMYRQIPPGNCFLIRDKLHQASFYAPQCFSRACAAQTRREAFLAFDEGVNLLNELIKRVENGWELGYYPTALIAPFRTQAEHLLEYIYLLGEAIAPEVYKGVRFNGR